MSKPFSFIEGENYEPMSKKDEVKIFKKYNKNKCQKAKAEILQRNIRLVIKIVRDEFYKVSAKNHSFKNSFDEADLISEGCIGINTAIDKFDVSRGIKFSTYASFWIKQQVLRYIANNARTIRLPVNFSEKLIKVKEFIREYNLKHGENPTKKTILNNFDGLSETALLNILTTNPMVYINQSLSDEEDSCEIGDTITDENCQSPSDLVSDKLELKDIECFLDRLSNKERDIIIKRFGFGGNKPMRLEEIGVEYNVTRERIRQIQTVALDKLGRMIVKSKNTMI